MFALRLKVCIIKTIERHQRNGENDMTKQDFIKAAEAKGHTVKNGKDAMWVADFMNKNYGSRYKLRDIYKAFKAAA